jgi:alpha-methylacyl-CoA racemase
VTSALDGLSVVEFAAAGPVQFCGRMLADHGADVIRIDRIGGWGGRYRAGGHMAVGAIEEGEYDALLRGLELDPGELPDRRDPAHWPTLRAAIGARFATRPRTHWCAVFADGTACVKPVLGLAEAPDHPHNQARDAFCSVDEVVQPAPAPRLSATPAAVRRGAPRAGQHTDEVLTERGLSGEAVARLRAIGAVR